MKPVTKAVGEARQRHILLLDTDPSVRDSLASALRSENYCVISAADDQEALKQLSMQPVDIALVGLPATGDPRWQVIQRLDAANPQLPLILLGVPSDRAQHPLAARAQAWFEKPLLDLPLLFKKVTELTVPNRPAGC